MRKKVKRVYDCRIRKVGNSYVITVPMELIEKYKLKVRDFVEVTIRV